MQAHGSNKLAPSASGSHALDQCPVCQGTESASVSGPEYDNPQVGQVHVMLESLFVPTARLLRQRGNALMEHLNTSVDRFLRDRSCKKRPAIMKTVRARQIYSVYLIGTVEGDKGEAYPKAMDYFTVPIDPDLNGPYDAKESLHPQSFHVHASPRWPSEKQAYVITVAMPAEPGLSNEQGHVRKVRWTKNPKDHPALPGSTFRFSERELDRIEQMGKAQWEKWQGLTLEQLNEYTIQFQTCLDSKTRASQERCSAGGSQKSTATLGDLFDEALKAKNAKSEATSAKSKSQKPPRNKPQSVLGARSSRVPDLFPLEEEKELDLSQIQLIATANPRYSIASTTDSEGPRTPEQTPATLSNPHVVGEDISSSHPGRSILPGEAHASPSSSSVRMSVASSKRRTHLDPIPVRDGESHKESRRAKKRASIGSSRTVKADVAADIASSGAPEASETRRSGGGGFLRRMASNLSRRKV
ncbi:hypothetical protein PENSPDRAFT_731412 [Peniophora sp. CONT]|nr:hypothetical protein PENSPDRAFT_731412 [Peniophora sp. CONT]